MYASSLYCKVELLQEAGTVTFYNARQGDYRRQERLLTHPIRRSNYILKKNVDNLLKFETF